jgi:hypothetical protein
MSGRAMMWGFDEDDDMVVWVRGGGGLVVLD